MAYDVPGRADDLNEELVARWNETIKREYTARFEIHGSRFITADPSGLRDAELDKDIKWFADPAAPVNCLDRAAARRLADWHGGRMAVQDEYAEYAIERRPNETGEMRPKRVQVTTELSAYWATVAAADPETLADMAEDALGRRPGWEELYGLPDPHKLSEERRTTAFATQLGGLENTPRGELNTANALFMTNPINGLDDLLYIVMFGARPYSVRLSDGSTRPAGGDEMFAHEHKLILACRHADPTDALKANAAASEGRTVAFADPLGMYIRSFDQRALAIDGEPLPDEWVRWGRGEAGMRQRLVIGPPDDDEHFLDDITVSVGAADEPLVGGFQLLQLIEVGPLVVVGPPSDIDEADVVIVAEIEDGIDCSGPEICTPIVALQKRVDRELGLRRTGERTVSDPNG
jgi:hypothetical protein